MKTLCYAVMINEFNGLCPECMESLYISGYYSQSWRSILLVLLSANTDCSC